MNQTIEAVYANGVLRPVTMLLDLLEGQRVRLTVGPVSEIQPEELAQREMDFLRQMDRESLLETDPVPVEGPSPVDFQPLVLEGEPLSETIVKMRRE